MLTDFVFGLTLTLTGFVKVSMKKWVGLLGTYSMAEIYLGMSTAVDTRISPNSNVRVDWITR